MTYRRYLNGKKSIIWSLMEKIWTLKVWAKWITKGNYLICKPRRWSNRTKTKLNALRLKIVNTLHYLHSNPFNSNLLQFLHLNNNFNQDLFRCLRYLQCLHMKSSQMNKWLLLYLLLNKILLKTSLLLYQHHIQLTKHHSSISLSLSAPLSRVSLSSLCLPSQISDSSGRLSSTNLYIMR